MNSEPDIFFFSVIHNKHEATLFILASVSLDPELVHLQMEEIKKYSQDATPNYLVNTSTPNTNLLDTTDEKI